MNDFRSFKELEVYQKACDFRRIIYELSKRFPSDERFRLVDQIIRSTRKCPANIAEGHGRFHYQENIQFCRIARGSLSETQDHLTCAFECDYISQSELENLTQKAQVIIRMLNGYIRYLDTKKKATKI